MHSHLNLKIWFFPLQTLLRVNLSDLFNDKLNLYIYVYIVTCEPSQLSYAWYIGLKTKQN